MDKYRILFFIAMLVWIISLYLFLCDPCKKYEIMV